MRREERKREGGRKGKGEKGSDRGRRRGERGKEGKGEKKEFTLGNPFFLPSCIHPTNSSEHYHMPGTPLGAGDREVNKVDNISALMGFTYEHGGQTLKCVVRGMRTSAVEKSKAKERHVEYPRRRQPPKQGGAGNTASAVSYRCSRSPARCGLRSGREQHTWPWPLSLCCHSPSVRFGEPTWPVCKGRVHAPAD